MQSHYDRWLESPCTDGGDLDEAVEGVECHVCGEPLDYEAQQDLLDTCASSFDPQREMRTAWCSACWKKEDPDE